MNRLLRSLLSRFLWLGVDEELPPDDIETPEPTDSMPEPEGQSLDDMLDAVEPTSAKDDATAKLTAAERRAEQLERELASERAARQRPSVPTGRDPEYEAEEAQIANAQNAGYTQEQMEWLRWKISNDRSIREAKRSSQSALMEARDLNDRAEFEKLELTKPKTYRAYKQRVDQAIANARSQGQTPPSRMMVLKYLIGEDMVEGKVKAKAPKVAASGEPTGRVERQRIPLNRSDVTDRAARSEREKRIQRLENKLI